MPLLTARALWLLLSAGLWLLLAGWWPQVESLFWIQTGCVIAIITWDALRARQNIRNLIIERVLPSQMGLHEPEVVDYRWSRRAGIPLRIELKESGMTPLPGVSPWPLVWDTGTLPGATIGLVVTPSVRGPMEFPEFRVRATTSLGLVRWQQRRVQPATTLVLPGLRALQDLRLWARREHIALGSTRLPRKEEGTQFKELRPYVPGDSMRSIDWKASARRGQMIVRELEPERAQSLMLLIDCGRAMRIPVEGIARIDAALSAALALAWVAVQRGDLVGAAAFGERMTTFMPPRSGSGQIKLMLEQLGQLQAESIEPDYRLQFAAIASLIRKRTLIVLFTEVHGRELSAELLAGIRMLARRHLPVVVTLPDPRLEALLDQTPVDDEMLYRQAAAAEVVTERAGALEAIAEAGGIVVDVPPGRLSSAVVNAYIRIKARGRL